MNRIFLILTLLLAIVVVGSILLMSLFGPKKATPTPQPVIKSDVTPSPQSRPVSSSPNKQVLTLISVNPAEDTTQTYFPIKQIFFTFSEPIDPNTFTAEASPNAKIIVTLKSDDPGTVIISPQEKWQPGITAITISAAISASGSQLDRSITYKINTQFPENPPPDSPGL